MAVIGRIFGGGGASTPELPPIVQAPTRSDAEIQAEKEKLRKIRSKAQGLSATILTDPSKKLEEVGPSTILTGV